MSSGKPRPRRCDARPSSRAKAEDDWQHAPRKQLRKALSAAELSEHATAIMALARPSIRLMPEPPNAVCDAVGDSRFGGRADLTSVDVWPMHDNRAQTFLCQIRLDELATTYAHVTADGLPASGLLSFFSAGAWGDPNEDDGSSWSIAT